MNTPSKRSISVSLDERVADQITKDHINTSGLVNELVKKYLRGEVEL
jgi:hypothetical protein